MKAFNLLMFAFLALIVTGAIGWVLNIVTVVHLISDPITGMFVLRCVGILLAPLGAILGFI